VQPLDVVRKELGCWAGPDGVTFQLASPQNVSARELNSLFRYWQSRAAGRLAPTRADIIAKDIPAVLRSLHLYEVQDAGRAFRLRLVGTQLVDAVGSDPTGKILTAKDRDPMYQRVFLSLQQVLEHRGPIRMMAERSSVPQMSFLPAESLLLPLSEGGKTIDKILAATIFLHGPALA
jgi:hypothetical protein